MTTAFADRLIAATRKHGPLCVGLDPHPDLFPRLFGSANAGSVAVWSDAVIEAIAGHVGVVKPQAAFFEIWGAPGMAALDHVCGKAREAGLLVILDAKRGDIGSSAAGYARAYLGANAAIPCDALTVNPYLGVETIQPFIDEAAKNGRGVAVLARTSNPGSADIQALEVDGRTIYRRVAERMQEMGTVLKGPETGWSGLMLVAGATGPGDALDLRRAAPDALFLVPGYGAQGAGADEAVAGFVKREGGAREGGVVNASRSITFCEDAQSATSLEAWTAAVSGAARAAQADLIAATRRSA